MALRLFLLLLATANLLIPITLLTFATGFFPYKPFIKGRASYRSDDEGVKPAPAPFNKIIFMVVDALRSDFVYGQDSGFSFVQGLIRNGTAIPFTAHAASPTITMPRVKAITTGSIPSFLDVILNFAESDTTSSLAGQDTWLSQLKQKDGGKLVMYGDDTWLKLFPNTFERADGTSSFFVSDFTQVDNNVTRNLPQELQKDDWDGMIMHYLGLDHIGHKSGPRSPHMKPKQTEMDGIVRHIYTSIEQDQHLSATLLVLCGDHGMNDAGNHGGAAEGETSPALVFISPMMRSITAGLKSPSGPKTRSFDYYTQVEQSDIAPTLAGLLGFPVPLNNLGVFIPTFLPFWRADIQSQLVVENAQQILNIVQDAFPSVRFDQPVSDHECIWPSSEGMALRCQWLDVEPHLHQDHQACPVTIEKVQGFCRSAQELMSNAASNYNVQRLYIGIVLSMTSVLLAVMAALHSLPCRKGTGAWIILTTALFGAMMFGSSFVEEEHHYWNWMTAAWFAWLAFKQQSYPCVKSAVASFSLLLTSRIIRVWNQTGQKHAGEGDIASTYLPANRLLLWSLVFVTYATVVRRLSKSSLRWAPPSLATSGAVILGTVAFAFKIAFTAADAPELIAAFMRPAVNVMEGTHLITQARAVFLGIGFTWLLSILPSLSQASHSDWSLDDGLHSMHDLLSLFLLTQSRITNIPVFLLSHIQYLSLGALDLAALETTFTCLLQQHTLYFALGGSNAISSIDLSSAYNGVSGYSVVAVGVLTFVSNWSGPIWWTSASMLLLYRQRYESRAEVLKQHLSILTLFASVSTLSVMAACTLLRAHLFVWTVFSPKYLYSMAWGVGQHLCVDIGLGTLAYLAESRKRRIDSKP